MKKFLAAALAALTCLLPLSAHAASKGKVLVVVSSADHFMLRDGVRYKTGYFLNELAVPVQRLIAAGYEPVFANPQGNEPAMDRESENAMFFGNSDAKRRETLAFVRSLPGLRAPLTLQRVLQQGGAAPYAGVYLPGGHAPMTDLVEDRQLGELLRQFHAAGKPTALMCHGPIAVLSALPQPAAFRAALDAGDERAAAALSASWVYAGYRLAVFSVAEERVAEKSQLGGQVRWYPGEALALAGAKVEVGRPWASQVVVDRELITGQQPFSDDALAEKLIATLDSQRAVSGR
jgi:putative intracellular protease/amidase